MTKTVSERLTSDAAPLPSVGRWQPVQRIDEGNYTVVYRARPLDYCGSADYVVKVLKPEYRAVPHVVGHLSTEAFLGRVITHNNLVSVLSSDVDAPPFYLVQPYLEGVTLQQSSSNQNLLSVPFVLWAARQTAQALRALHNRHWLHGDVNPTNIVVSPQGHVTLIDLGLARRCDARPEEQAVEGTLGYMAPETFVPTRALGAAADIYSLGVMLFEQFTGRLPFDQADPARLAAAHLREQPPCARTIRPQLPSRVAWLVKRMLSKEPLRRPATEELIDLLVDLEVELFAER